MTRKEMIDAVEGEISRLQQVREILARSNSDRFTTPDGAGRTATTSPRAKRVLSPEARRRIAQAQKRRWAKQKREAVTTEK